jgi:hypothetical protein
VTRSEVLEHTDLRVSTGRVREESGRGLARFKAVALHSES